MEEEEEEEEKKEEVKYKYTFLRHEESKSNKYGPIVGRDPILTEEGKENAKKIKGYYDYALISIMKRTRQTFELSNINANHIEYSSLCREYRNEPASLLIEEKQIMESSKDFYDRIKLLKQYLIQLGEKHKTIIIVTHHGVIEEITEKSVNNGEFIGTNIIF
jgi:broad specificity phosphatase PhoE